MASLVHTPLFLVPEFRVLSLPPNSSQFTPNVEQDQPKAILVAIYEEIP